jgi:hypothetical protein
MKKRPLLLLEVVIGLGLIALLFSSLFAYLVQAAKTEARLRDVRAAALSTELAERRISSLFATLIPPSEIEGKKAFYTSKLPGDLSPSLFFWYDNGIDPDPLFSGPLVGRLFVDGEKRLRLESRPIPQEEGQDAHRLETLLSRVERLEWQFLTPSPSSISPPAEKVLWQWRPEWPPSEELPPCCRIVIRRAAAPPLRLAFPIGLASRVFPLPSRKPPPRTEERPA